MKSEQTDSKTITTTETAASSNPTATPKKKRAAKKQAQTTIGRAATKKVAIVTLLKRPKGATLKELLKATGWQAHSVRGFLSAVVGKNMGLKLTILDRDGERAYQVKG